MAFTFFYSGPTVFFAVNNRRRCNLYFNDILLERPDVQLNNCSFAKYFPQGCKRILRKFRSANENVNENENFRSFLRKFSLNFFREIRSNILQKSRNSFKFSTFCSKCLFAKMQSSWCEMETFRFLSQENFRKIEVENKSKFVKILKRISLVHFSEFRSTKISTETLLWILFTAV